MAASRRTTRSSAMNRPDPFDFSVQFMSPPKLCLLRPKGRFCLTRAMSALGQKRTCAVHLAMSAFLPIATSIAFLGMSALGQKRTLLYSLRRLAKRGEKDGQTGVK